MGYEHREVSERSYGQGVGGIGASSSQAQESWEAEEIPTTGDSQWDLLCAEEWVFLEDDAEGSSALEDGLPLLQAVEGGWDLGEYKPGASREDEEEAGEG